MNDDGIRTHSHLLSGHYKRAQCEIFVSISIHFAHTLVMMMCEIKICIALSGHYVKERCEYFVSLVTRI